MSAPPRNNFDLDILSELADGVVVADVETRAIVAANTAFCNLLGYTPEQIQSFHIEDLHPAEDQSLVKDTIQRQVAGDGLALGIPVKCADGTRLYVDINSSVFDEDGQTLIVGVFRDATKRLEGEAALAESERMAQSYLDIADVILVALDVDGNVIMINREGCDVLGYDESEILGKNWYDNYLPEHVQQELRSVAKGVLNGDFAKHRYRNPVLTRSGEERMVFWRNSMIKDKHGKVVGTLSSGTDITEQDRLEAEMHQLQKMEAIGQLAGGLAHDYNNMLMSIRACCDLLGDDIPQTSPMQQELREIKDCVRRGAELNEQLLAFSKKQVLRMEDVDLYAVVSGMRGMLQRLLGERITITMVQKSERTIVRADKVRLEQMVMNLAINARDAMPDGGNLDIEISSVEMSERVVRENMKPGRYVSLMVSDTGCGMTEAQQEHVFEPFYTTKAESGTGLGLSTVYGVVKQSNGFIDFCTEPDHGTCFSVYIPASDGKPVETIQAPLKESIGAGELILVAEDEYALRRIMVRMLESGGYRVMPAADGAEAFALLEGSEGVDLILSDVMMPNMTGPQLAKAVQEAQMDLPIILISGYTDDRIDALSELDPPPTYLQKPCTKEDLLRAVREVLDIRKLK